MKVAQKPRFYRAYKKLPIQIKGELDAVIRILCKNPEIGILKVRNLSGIRIYKFKLNKQPLLFVYQWIEERSVLILLSIGSHENFYRDLAKQYRDMGNTGKQQNTSVNYVDDCVTASAAYRSPVSD